MHMGAEEQQQQQQSVFTAQEVSRSKIKTTQCWMCAQLCNEKVVVSFYVDKIEISLRIPMLSVNAVWLLHIPLTLICFCFVPRHAPHRRVPATHLTPRPYQTAKSPTLPYQSNASSTVSNANVEKTTINRLAKLLNQTIKGSDASAVLRDDAPRRLSWER